MKTLKKKKEKEGLKTHMLVVENTHDQVVGTVILVTYENLFVAKTSASPKNTEQHRFRLPTGSESREGRQPGKLEECVCVCV